jgi:two-component system, chemotaxis family, protein-glutamate methylesterase/glutaminase
MKRLSYQPIRVLIVEDSRSQRELLVGLLRASSDFEVVGMASNGKAAVAEAQRLRPQVIAMDIHLPILDGYEATRQIMRQCPTPIVLISSQADTTGRTIEALAAGALAVVGKPGACLGALTTDDERVAFLTTLRLMAGVPVVTRHSPRASAAEHRGVAAGGRLPAVSQPTVLAIAASTGGPAAVQTVLRGLGAGFPLPILLVQHITGAFIPLLGEWLNKTTALAVRVAQQGERLVPGQIYMAPQDHHIIVYEPGVVGLRPLHPGDRFCPSADVLFESVARICGARAIGLVLTGMGDDGAHGLLALHAAGAPTLAQNEASCVVYGMPRAAIEAGAITRTETLMGIVAAISELVAASEATGGHRKWL